MTSRQKKTAKEIYSPGEIKFKIRQYWVALQLAIRFFGDLRTVVVKGFYVLRTEGFGGLGERLTILLNQSAGLITVRSSGRPVFPATNQDRSRSWRRTQSVDVVVCVHNAPEDTRRCLESVAANTFPPYRLVIVDDGSGPDTRQLLDKFVLGQPALLIRNDIAQGYTHAANQGLRASQADYVVLLNSDTVVGANWLDRLVACAISDKEIGIVGPLSNAASWQSIPQIFDSEGDWHDTHLPAGWTATRMAAAIATASTCIYPRVGFVNGFCFLIRRSALNSIGFFDEDYFGAGYGEENDYCIRAHEKNWRAAIADDVYVFHAQSRSYSHQRRLELSQRASVALRTKHGRGTITSLLEQTTNHPALEYMRKRSQFLQEDFLCKAKLEEKFEGRRVLFLLPVGTSGGGGNVVLTEVAALRAAGVEAWIGNLASNRTLFERCHPDNGIPVLYFTTPEELETVQSSFDALVATLYLTTEWMKPVALGANPPRLGYYVQDFEPFFFTAGSSEHDRALESYTSLPSMRLFTKTRWTRDIVFEKTGRIPDLVGPSFDLEHFFPGSNYRSPLLPVKIVAMVRFHTPRRAPEATMRTLRKLKRRFGSSIAVEIFGTRADDPAYLESARDFDYLCHGEASPPVVAEILRSADLFLDMSLFQAMGLTAMEAMASGCVVIGPINGGLGEVIAHEISGILIDTQDEDACLAATSQLIRDASKRTRLRNNAFNVIRWTPSRSALALMECLFASDPGGQVDHE